MSSPSLLQQILLTQGSNLYLLHCWQILYHLSHQGAMTNLYSILKSRDITLHKGPYNQSYGFSSSHVRMWELDYGPRRLSTTKLMLSNCGSGKDSWEFLGLQGDQTSQSQRKSTLNIFWKDWWSWSSNVLATWWKELTQWKRPWCWERLKAKGEGGGRGWDC